MLFYSSCKKQTNIIKHRILQILNLQQKIRITETVILYSLLQSQTKITLKISCVYKQELRNSKQKTASLKELSIKTIDIIKRRN